MKFVILHRKQIPGFGVSGPIMTPTEYDIHQVLKWVIAGIDIREVMEDGSYRKLTFNDERLMEELSKKMNKQMEKREQQKAKQDNQPKIVGGGNVRLVPEKKKAYKSPKPKKEEPKPQPKAEPKVEEPKQPDLFIDELEKPE